MLGSTTIIFSLLFSKTILAVGWVWLTVGSWYREGGSLGVNLRRDVELLNSGSGRKNEGEIQI